MIKSIVSIRSLAVIAVLGVTLTTAAVAEKPNVLIIYADDLGYGDLSCYNKNSKIPTPNLDRLASEGMRFTDGHSSSGICTPSRYALLTGRYHWRDFYGIVSVMGNSVFKPERLTLPEMMQQKGYTTSAIGKWHLGWDWDSIRKGKKTKEGNRAGKKRIPGSGRNHFSQFDWSKPIPNGPLEHGFDYYFGDTVINFPPYCWIENNKVVKAPDTMMDTKEWKAIKEGGWECRPGPMVTGWDPYQNIPITTQKGIDFIKEQAKTDKPFFLYFAYPSPHAPIIPNDVFDGKSKAGPYGDLVVETDDSIGKLLHALEETGQAKNTIVIFSADNGPEKYAYPRDGKYDHWSAFPLRGLKRDIYEGGHRVPYIVKYPGVVGKGKVSNALVSQIDIMATLASVIDFKLPDQNAAEDSYDLMPLLRGQAETVRTTHVHNTKAASYAIRNGEWLLIKGKNGYITSKNKKWEAKHKYPADNQQAFELYHLGSDLSQRMNVAAKHPEKVSELKKTLDRIQKQGHSAPRLIKEK